MKRRLRIKAMPYSEQLDRIEGIMNYLEKTSIRSPSLEDRTKHAIKLIKIIHRQADVGELAIKRAITYLTMGVLARLDSPRIADKGLDNAVRQLELAQKQIRKYR